MNRREFTVANEYTYDHRSPLRWLASHIVRYPVLLITFLVTTVGMAGAQSMSALMVGRAFDTVLEGAGAAALTVAALLVCSTLSTAWRSVCWRSASSAMPATNSTSAY